MHRGRKWPRWLKARPMCAPYGGSTNVDPCLPFEAFFYYDSWFNGFTETYVGTTLVPATVQTYNFGDDHANWIFDLVSLSGYPTQLLLELRLDQTLNIAPLFSWSWTQRSDYYSSRGVVFSGRGFESGFFASFSSAGWEIPSVERSDWELGITAKFYDGSPVVPFF